MVHRGTRGRRAVATLCNALHAIPPCTCVICAAAISSVIRRIIAGATLARARRGCEEGEREGGHRLIHARCFYIRGRKGRSGPVYG